MATGFSIPSTRRSKSAPISLPQRSQRSLVLMFVVTAALSGCLFRLAQLQLTQGSLNRGLAEKNRVSLIPLPSDRGNILDRQGRLLAANRLARSVYLAPREQSEQQWAETAKRLGPLLNLPPEEIVTKLQQAGYRSATPIRISRNLNPSAFVVLAEQAAQFPGIEIRAEASRYYPNGNLAAHVMGYISEATEADLKAHPQYPLGMLVGQMGVERIAEAALQGVWGARQLEVDAGGRGGKVLGTRLPQSGEAVKLTLDMDLQKAAEAALANRRGAAVAIDTQTGEVLVLASGPTFDPNLFTRQISQADWKRLQDEDKPFLNRALQGYAPGSTFKIVTAAAGMQSGKFSPDSTLVSSAYISLGGFQFHEHGSGYGLIGFPEAFAVSSNTFFYQVGLASGPEEISKWGHLLGIGETTNLGLEGGSHGQIPTPAQKEKMYKEPWYGGDTVSMSIGQGLVQATPLEMAVMVGTIANGGLRVKPHLLASQTNTPATQPQKTGLNPDVVAVIRQGLLAVVQQGTAKQLSDGSIPPTGGKTGTAEVQGQRDNAVYVGFGPADNPRIALAVVVENGGFGAESAVPIAHEIYKAYFKKPGTPAPANP
jgi:penicillin-binding protein 2